MSKVKSFRLLFLVMIVVAILFPFLGQTSTKSMGQDERPDRINIEIEIAAGKDEMPAVSFMHDHHTEALDGKCAACHLEEDKAFVFKFKRTDKKVSMDLYHNECVACHVEKEDASEPSGPGTAECRACHGKKETEKSSWVEIKFDKSLHYRHESSDQIKGVDSSDDKNCSTCHHQYNEKTKEIFYVKGEESSCFYCHKSEELDTIRPIREAAHDSCVKCHQTFKDKKVSAGPVTCAGCHEKAQQKKIKKLTDIPRLKRNQPDVVAITGWKTDSKVKDNYMPGVAFDHKFHEAEAETCKACHHQTLEKCGDCHGIQGGESKGGFVSLEKAMHQPGSTRSCIGCHNDAAKNSDCAGCHFQAPDRKGNDESCKTCHRIKPTQLGSGDTGSVAKKTLKDLKAQYKPVKVDKIPETIKIDVLSDEYQPSVFPHRKVVQAILERVEKSQMAKAFHTDQAGLCMGCHHNSPKTLEPPKCAACHSKNGPASDGNSDGRPGLKGAYHGQCITCHQKMEVSSVSATDCAKCHEEKK